MKCNDCNVEMRKCEPDQTYTVREIYQCPKCKKLCEVAGSFDATSGKVTVTYPTYYSSDGTSYDPRY